MMDKEHGGTGLPYDRIRLVFTDLDGTLYPGAHDADKVAKPGLMANMAAVRTLEARGLPVVPATGNNVGFAQLKMLDPATGEKLRDLSNSPGIYCNGALVKGAGGKEIAVRSLGDFLPGFTDRWMLVDTTSQLPPSPEMKVIAGLGKERVFFLQDPRLSSVGKNIAGDFTTLMMIPDTDYQWLPPCEFKAAATEVLSLLILLPQTETSDSAELLQLQQWLHAAGLLKFDEPGVRKSNGEAASESLRLLPPSDHQHAPPRA